MKKSILFTSLAAAVLSSALVSAEETPVESLASSTDSTVVTTETSSTASSETLSDIIATGTPAASVTEMSETTAPSDTASAVTEPSSTEPSSTEPLSEQSSAGTTVTKIEYSDNAEVVTVHLKWKDGAGAISGYTESMLLNSDGTLSFPYGSEVLTVSADKVPASLVAKLKKQSSAGTTVTKIEYSDNAEVVKVHLKWKDGAGVISGYTESMSLNSDGTLSFPYGSEVLTVSADKVPANLVAKLKQLASSSTTESSIASTTPSSEAKTETSSTKTESTTTTASSTEASTSSAVDFEALKSNDFSSVVGKRFSTKDGKILTITADGSLVADVPYIDTVGRKLRYVKTKNGQLWFVPETALGVPGDIIFSLIPAGVEFTGTDSSRTRLVFPGPVGPEGPTVYYLDGPVQGSEAGVQAETTSASLADHTCLPTEDWALLEAHASKASKPAQQTTKAAETAKTQASKLPATGEQSGLVAGLLGAGLLAMTAILRKRKAN